MQYLQLRLVGLMHLCTQASLKETLDNDISKPKMSITWKNVIDLNVNTSWKKQMVNVNIPLSIIVAQENTHENLMASGRDFFLWLMIIFVFSMCTTIQR